MKNFFIYKKTPDIHAQFGKYVWDTANEGVEYIFTRKVNRAIRSLPQNRLFHVICQIYAMYTGHTMQEIKDEFKSERFFKMETDKQGVLFKRLRSTAKLDTTEFTSLVNNLLEWGRDKWPKCVVPRKEDMNYIMLMEIESQYEREFFG
jgi:hypothetical protein